MPFIYIYSPSDFVSGLPDEQGAAAAGSGPFELTLSATASPTIIEINDNDSVLDEIDNNQTIANDVTIDGTFYAAGTRVSSAYDLINSDNGHQVTSVHFGGNGYQQGAVDGLVSTEPLVAGQSYSFDVERTSHRQDNEYEEFVACFAQGTLIQTPDGTAAVESLQPQDLVRSIDGTDVPVQLRLSRHLGAAELRANPKLRPIRITAGALGQGLPTRDLLVSPQHRMLATGALCARMFGEEQVLVSARKLEALPGIYADQTLDEVTYHHIIFAAHQVVFAEAAPSESFFPGRQAIEGMDAASKDELFAIFPELSEASGPMAPLESARVILADRAQKDLVARLCKNAQPVLSDKL